MPLMAGGDEGDSEPLSIAPDSLRRSTQRITPRQRQLVVMGRARQRFHAMGGDGQQITAVGSLAGLIHDALDDVIHHRKLVIADIRRLIC